MVFLEEQQLARLVPYLEAHDYIAPLVVAVESHDSLAFNCHGDYDLSHIRSEFKEIIPDFACPFNGILYSRKLIETIGYPIPSYSFGEMSGIMRLGQKRVVSSR